jgi:hypothetical protein
VSKLPPILKHVLEESKRPLTEREFAAGERLVLGTGTILDLIEARRAARQSPPSR